MYKDIEWLYIRHTFPSPSVTKIIISHTSLVYNSPQLGISLSESATRIVLCLYTEDNRYLYRQSNAMIITFIVIAYLVHTNQSFVAFKIIADVFIVSVTAN